MPQNRRILLRGADLYHAIVSMQAGTLKYAATPHKHFEIAKETARVMVKTGNFEGLLRRNRIVFIRDIDKRRPNIHDHKFRDGRAMLQFTPVTPKTVKIWDRVLSGQPLAAFKPNPLWFWI